MTRKITLLFMIALSAAIASFANNTSDKKAIVLFTTDVHGHFFPYDFVNATAASGSLSRAATAVDSIRTLAGKDNVVLLDNGDILQGQPTVYYYNFINTDSPHIVDEIYRFMGYDMTSVGNHDIETGHKVYDRWSANAGIPVLAANVIDKSTGQPYFKPYAIIERGGMRIAVIGLLTPAIPAWLPENLWAGLEFLPMEETARKWIDLVSQKETPDAIIGLFHSGHDASKTTAGYKENESLTIARNVTGFDAVLMGHDHQLFCDTVLNRSGHPVAVVNPANNANNLGMLTLTLMPEGGVAVNPSIIDISNIEPSADFLSHFEKQRSEVKKFVDEEIAMISDDISTRDAYFGPSAFMTLLHKLQLEISGADISMAAPLTFDGSIRKGPMTIADMFTLYKYENTLCTLLLTGKEIKDYLEYSYSLWTDRIESPDDHLINFASGSPTNQDNRLKNPSYNFDSASGIDYIVDVTQPTGNKIKIIQMSDGRPFDMLQQYKVAVNSYRAGGGGNHLTIGSGITPDDLKKRIVSTTEKDLRFYLMEAIKNHGSLSPDIENNWKFVPSEKVDQHIAVDRELLFGASSSKIQK